MKGILALTVLVLAAGCASYNGSSLVPGKSTAAEVEALMGVPAERLQRPNGERVLYYPRSRETYAVVLGSDGLVRAVEPRLLKSSLSKLVPGVTTAKEVRELFGPPQQVTQLARQQREVWEYLYQHYEEFRVIWVQYSPDGLVREVLDMIDWAAYPPSGDAAGMP